MSSNTEGPLSAYWVRFFKAAGFSPDVATRHAVVFSNNRIQPDMLPDLDKPSLREMGITLMGDMIAILRYAKKVVEETTCERFLVDSNDLVPTKKTPAKSTPPKAEVTAVTSKVCKSTSQMPVTKVLSKTVNLKKKLPTRTITVAPEKTKQQSIKRKIVMDTIHIESDLDEDDGYVTEKPKKRTKITVDDNVGYKIIMPKGTTVRSQTILKKAVEQKRTVFDRLGDSSVTSTTNSGEGGCTTTTFNITGLGKPLKRTTNNVFNRLGDKDLAKEDKSRLTSLGVLKNGSSLQGILKNKSVSSPKMISTKKIVKVPGGTMHADFERKKRVASSAVTQSVTSSKLASERFKPVSAKERLGISKQVTFNKITSVARVQKPDVFSRLGI